jgi:hypothetical protein
MRALLVASTLLVSLPALAWEAICRDPGEAASSPTRLSGPRLEHALENHEDDNCTGMGAARGHLLGEHAWITRRAMQLAGFENAFIDDAMVFHAPQIDRRMPVPRGYFTLGPSRIAPNVTSQEATGPGRMSRWVTREASFPELSEIPDWSHSLSDWVMGNERCLPRNVPRATLEDVEVCHLFRGHMGSINSTHWPPLSRVIYKRYHGIALGIAARCKQMRSQVPTDISPVREHMLEQVAACEREAIAFEAYGSHFLQDAFASGHMFYRWGAPSFRRSRVEQFRDSLAALVTGIIHGTRAVTGSHDRANMPGPDGETQTLFKWRASDTTQFSGGGDLYLRPSTEKFEGWNVSEGPRLRPQYNRMMDCVVSGFREVYEAGPKTVTVGALGIAPREPGFPLSDACWEQRLTNRSMLLALGTPAFGLFGFDAEDLASPGYVTYLKLSIAQSRGTTERQLGLSDDQEERELLRFRDTLQRLALAYQQRAAEDPEGVDLANMDGPSIGLRDAFGRAPGQTQPAVHWNGAYEAELETLGFLESRNFETWENPYPLIPCATDDNCQDGHYCDYNYLVRGTPFPTCVRHETGLVRAFREAETPRFCAMDTWDDLEAARAACNAAGPGSDACRSCVQVVAPRIRNACDPGPSFTPRSNGVDNRSMCDHYGTALFRDRYIHIPYELEGATETWEQALARVATKACLDGPDYVLPTGYDYKFTPDPNVTPYPIHTVTSRTYFEATCGKGIGTHWFAFTATAPAESALNFGIALRTARQQLYQPNPEYPWAGDVNDLLLEMFEGPNCDPNATPVRAPDAPTIKRLSWLVPAGTTRAMCVRVMVRSPSVRTGYLLSIGRPPAF